MMESEQFGAFVDSNVDLLAEAVSVVDNFPVVVRDFIMSQPQEFVSEAFDPENLTDTSLHALQETYKKITTFAEFATKQFLTEMSSIYGQVIGETSVVTESQKPSINRYL